MIQIIRNFFPIENYTELYTKCKEEYYLIC